MRIFQAIFITFMFYTVPISGQHFNLKIGTSKIEFESIKIKTDTIVFINLHSDEVTSINAIRQVLPSYYGKFIQIKSGGKREVIVSEKGNTIKFDPNRIFTPKGIEKTLRNYACYSELNVKLVNSFSTELLKYLSKAKLLIALHNNNNASFSVNSILKEKQIKKDALDVYVNTEKDEDDFYYVTEKSKFDYFKKGGYNVVLQDNINVEDDGSLSVWCGKHKIDYINIECQSGHLQEQVQMITEIYKLLEAK